MCDEVCRGEGERGEGGEVDREREIERRRIRKVEKNKKGTGRKKS